MNAVEQIIRLLHENNLWEGTKTIKRNDYLVKSGRTDTKIYFVESGSLRIFLVDKEDEHCIRFGYQGSIIAALDSFVTHSPTQLTIQAIKKSKLKWVSRTAYLNFMHSNPDTTLLWNEMLFSFIFQQMEREQDLIISSPHKRYKRVLKRSPHLFQEIPHKYIASYLRMSPETLSRVKSVDLDQGK